MHTSRTSHPLQMFEGSIQMWGEATHPRLTPLILVEPYGKPNARSRFSTIMLGGVAWTAHVWAKRNTAAAVALKALRDMGSGMRGVGGRTGRAMVYASSVKPIWG